MNQKAKTLFTAALVLVLLGACADEPTPPPRPTEPIRTTLAEDAAIPTQPIPTLAPTATPLPDADTLLAQAQTAAHNGDVPSALRAYDQAIGVLNPTSEQALNARLQRAVLAPNTDDLQRLVTDAATNPSTQTDAHILLSHAVNAISPTQSISHFAAALAQNSVLTPYLNLWLGDAYVQSNQPLNAVAPYQQAIRQSPNTAIEFGRREKLALAFRLAGQPANAINEYQIILARAQIPAYQARMKWEMAQDQIALGQFPRTLILELINTYPKTPQAALALQTALQNNLAVDELQRGIINVYANNFAGARDAFRRAIAAGDTREDDVRFWAAQNYINQNLPEDALRNLNQTITANANTLRVTQAHAEKAKLYASLENGREAFAALDALLGYANPVSDTAELFFSVGVAFERKLWLEQAERIFSAVGETGNPNVGAQAYAKAAALQLRRNNAQAALQTSQTAYAKYPNNATTQFWLGKTQLAAGNAPSATATLQQLAQTQPDSFAGIRAKQLLTQQAPFANTKPANVASLPSSQADAEQWLAGWVSPTQAVTNTAVLQDIRFVRGAALLRLGFEPEALGEFGAVLNAYARDPIALFQLAIALRDNRAYRLSISAADSLMRLSPSPTPSAMPKFISELLYPVYYSDLVQQHANEFGVDPLLVFSVMRQESLFEAYAESSATAQGLMQVMPSTGAEIARELQVADYGLNNPATSIRFGCYYLAKQLRIFKGDVFAALAAYNAGAGNALRWQERAGGAGADPDLFYNFINFEETQRYVRNIQVNWVMYGRVYGE